MSILCSLKNINLSFGEKELFRNAELSILAGDKIGLIGLNGSGKSSLFKILTKEISPDTSIPLFRFDKASGKTDLSKQFSVFYIPQEIPLKPHEEVTARDFIYRFYPEINHIKLELNRLNEEIEKKSNNKLIQKQKDLLEKFEHIDGWNTIKRYESYLKFFELTSIDSKVTDLSGGEQKKILLSLGLSASAKLILWDEPTNHIDIETIKIFEDELLQSDKTFILVSHDRYLLSKVTKKILHIQNGSFLNFDGNYYDYLNFLADRESIQQALITRLKNRLKREQDWMNQGIKARGTRSKKRVENYRDLKKTISTLKSETKKSIQLTISKSKRETKKLLDFSDVSFSYDDKKIFKNLNFEIRKKDKIGLLGPNGIGKTTLVNLMALKLQPTEGTVKQAEKLSVKYFSQKREELNLESTPFKLLGDGGDFVELPNGKRRHVISYFESFLFHSGQIHRPIKTFSGGERNRLQMALNLKEPGDLLIFDEPTNDLDLETLNILEDKLSEFTGSLILISHDRAFLSSVTNKIWLINDDHTITNFEGGYSQVEPHLEALQLEKELLKEESTPKKESKKDTSPKKFTNKEKQRMKALPNEISSHEGQITRLEDEITSFDYSDMGEDQGLKLAKLTSKKDDLEEKLMGLYEEIDSLTS